MTPENPPPRVQSTRGHLLRVLGFGFGLAVIIGNTIGGGIFRAPGTIAQNLPDVWLFIGVWLTAGLYALLGAISLSELGAMIPQSGGQYAFARYALGEYAGFIVGWSDWISTCGSAAAISLLMGSFMGALFPALGGPTAMVLTACAVTLFFALLQWQGVVIGSTTQNITSLLKAVAFVTLIAAAFALGGNALTTPADTTPIPGVGLATAIILSLQAAIYAYDGWTGVIYFSEEVKNPGKDIPRSMIGGVLTIITIYLLVNLALIYVLPISQIAGKEFAAGEAANVLFGRHGETVFRSLTIVSLLSAINACHLMASRVLFAMSRDGLFFTKVSFVNKGGTPTVALLLGTVVTLIFIVFGQTFEKVITILAFFFVAMYVLSFVSVFVLRRGEPEKERPYRAWGYPWTTGLALVGSIAFLIGVIAGDTRNSLYALALLGVSYPMFKLLRRGM